MNWMLPSMRRRALSSASATARSARRAASAAALASSGLAGSSAPPASCCCSGAAAAASPSSLASACSSSSSAASSWGVAEGLRWGGMGRSGGWQWRGWWAVCAQGAGQPAACGARHPAVTCPAPPTAAPHLAATLLGRRLALRNSGHRCVALLKLLLALVQQQAAEVELAALGLAALGRRLLRGVVKLGQPLLQRLAQLAVQLAEVGLKQRLVEDLGGGGRSGAGMEEGTRHTVVCLGPRAAPRVASPAPARPLPPPPRTWPMRPTSVLASPMPTSSSWPVRRSKLSGVSLLRMPLNAFWRASSSGSSLCVWPTLNALSLLCSAGRSRRDPPPPRAGGSGPPRAQRSASTPPGAGGGPPRRPLSARAMPPPLRGPSRKPPPPLPGPPGRPMPGPGRAPQSLSARSGPGRRGPRSPRLPARSKPDGGAT
jgi:hypothetical protein